MDSKVTLLIGITPASGFKSLTYAALDQDLRLLSMEDGELNELAALFSSWNMVVAAINAPSGVHLGLVRELIKSKMQASHQVRGAEMRLCEYELRERGIVVSGTPSSERLSPAWVQLGFKLYHDLGKAGFSKYSANAQPYRLLETNPHACFCVLAGSVPLPRTSLEGRLQRQLLLFEHGVRIKDPMDFFEEITRYKLARGVWPVEMLYSPEQLDALAAAYTAWMAAARPQDVSMIGDRQEGQIVLPAPELKANYQEITKRLG
jgi:hypothetical protein